MEVYMNYINLACQIMTALVILSTLIVKLTPTDKDDIAVDNFKNKVLSLVHKLPYFGDSPKIKALEDALEAVKK